LYALYEDAVTWTLLLPDQTDDQHNDANDHAQEGEEGKCKKQMDQSAQRLPEYESGDP
jgi:hypothetical protein